VHGWSPRACFLLFPLLIGALGIRENPPPEHEEDDEEVRRMSVFRPPGASRLELVLLTAREEHKSGFR
jgi:hypothetical protein